MSIFVDALARSGYNRASRRNGPLDSETERHSKMTKVVIPNYSTAQEALILASAINGVFNIDGAKALADNPAMDGADGPRNYRSIIAKMSRMVTASGGELSYARKEPVTKDGKPVSKKSDIVATIAKNAGVAVAKLDGLEKAPKLALETLRDAFAA